MMRNEEVLSYNIGNKLQHIPAKYEIINEHLLPLDLYNIDDVNDVNKVIQTINNFIIDRNHILSQENQNILKENNPVASTKKGYIASIFHATSMTDSYWVKPDKSDLTWEQVNPRTNRLCDICTIKINDQPILQPQTDIQMSPDIRNGASPKIWKESLTNEHLEKELYKQNDERSGINEAELECIVSDILDHTNVPHVRYQMIDERMCKCKNMADDEKSIVSAAEFRSFCNRTGENMEEIIRDTDYSNYCKMKIIDYLIDNRDRTENNYGFYRDNDTGNITGLHPLFDHNNAFGNSHKPQEQISKSQLTDWLKYSHLKIDSLSLKTFHYDREKYTQFMKRACEIGICEKSKEKQSVLQKISGKEPQTVYRIKEEYLSEYLSYDKSVPYQILEDDRDFDSREDIEEWLENAKEETDRINNRTESREYERDNDDREL